jgi:hypothetical protein
MMKRKKFASLMPDQNIGNIGLEEALNFFASKDLGNIKRKKFRSVMGVMVHPFVMELLLLPKDPLE